MPALQGRFRTRAKNQFCAAFMTPAIDPANSQQGGAGVIPGTGVGQHTSCEQNTHWRVADQMNGI